MDAVSHEHIESKKQRGKDKAAGKEKQTRGGGL